MLRSLDARLLRRAIPDRDRTSLGRSSDEGTTKAVPPIYGTGEMIALIDVNEFSREPNVAGLNVGMPSHCSHENRYSPFCQDP